MLTQRECEQQQQLRVLEGVNEEQLRTIRQLQHDIVAVQQEQHSHSSVLISYDDLYAVITNMLQLRLAAGEHRDVAEDCGD